MLLLYEVYEILAENNLNSNLSDKVDAISGTTSEEITYEKVNGIGYDAENNKLMIKVGASTEPIPFSGQKAYDIRFTSSETNPAGYWYSSEDNGVAHEFNYGSDTICDGLVSYTYNGRFSMYVNDYCYVNGIGYAPGNAIILNQLWQSLKGTYQFFIVPA